MPSLAYLVIVTDVVGAAAASEDWITVGRSASSITKIKNRLSQPFNGSILPATFLLHLVFRSALEKRMRRKTITQISLFSTLSMLDHYSKGSGITATPLIFNRDYLLQIYYVQ